MPFQWLGPGQRSGVAVGDLRQAHPAQIAVHWLVFGTRAQKAIGVILAEQMQWHGVEAFAVQKRVRAAQPQLTKLIARADQAAQPGVLVGIGEARPVHALLLADQGAQGAGDRARRRREQAAQLVVAAGLEAARLAEEPGIERIEAPM
jgi:hypothetical protein